MRRQKVAYVGHLLDFAAGYVPPHVVGMLGDFRHLFSELCSLGIPLAFGWYGLIYCPVPQGAWAAPRSSEVPACPQTGSHRDVHGYLLVVNHFCVCPVARLALH